MRKYPRFLQWIHKKICLIIQRIRGCPCLSSLRPRVSRSATQSIPSINAQSGSTINTQDDLFEGTAQHCKRVTKRFEKTFNHYIRVPGGKSSQVEPDKWPTPTHAKVKLTPRYNDVPYWCPAASMTPNQWQLFKVNASMYKVKALGFKLDHIVPLTDELKNLSGSTVETTTFNERPYLIAHIDDKDYIHGV